MRLSLNVPKIHFMKKSVKIEQDGSYTFSINMKFDGSMLEMEDKIEKMVNELGIEATMKALQKFDTSGEDISHKGERLTSKGSQKKRTTRPTDKDE